MPKLYTSEWHISIEELSTMAESLKTGSLASLVCLVVFGNELFEVVVRSMRVAVFFLLLFSVHGALRHESESEDPCV